MKIKLWKVHTSTMRGMEHVYESDNVFETLDDAKEYLKNEYEFVVNAAGSAPSKHARTGYAAYIDNYGDGTHTIWVIKESIYNVPDPEPVSNKRWVLMYDDTSSPYVVPVDSVVLRAFDSEEAAVEAMNRELVLAIADLHRRSEDYDVKHGATFAAVDSDHGNQSWAIREMEVPV